MKIRFHSGSIRFRLRRADVADLVVHGRAEESVAAGDARLSFVLGAHDGPATARLEGPRLSVLIPRGDVLRWAESDAVGLRYELPERTRVLVEKDWACLEPAPGETDEGAFPRPATAAPACGPGVSAR